MNYEKHYNLLIERAKTRSISGYTEHHHIIPKCMGGADTKDNLVELTHREHYIAHQLLMCMNPGVASFVYSANAVMWPNKARKANDVNLLHRSWFKSKHSQAVSQHSIANKEAISRAVIKYNTTREITPELRANISAGLRQYYSENPVSDEAKKNNSLAQIQRFKDRPQTQETKTLRKQSCRASRGSPVIAWKNGEVIGIFGSGAEALENLESVKHTQPIYMCCKRRLEKDYPYSSYGYEWTYNYCKI